LHKIAAKDLIVLSSKPVWHIGLESRNHALKALKLNTVVGFRNSELLSMMVL